MQATKISIHAPREGGDIDSSRTREENSDFNPRPPRGGRPIDTHEQCGQDLFQSTPPARGATQHINDMYQYQQYFNPRPPRGGRRSKKYFKKKEKHFNPRPPRGGRLQRTTGEFEGVLQTFQSTPPARGATGIVINPDYKISISIHAPREGGDSKGSSEH